MNISMILYKQMAPLVFRGYDSFERPRVHLTGKCPASCARQSIQAHKPHNTRHLPRRAAKSGPRDIMLLLKQPTYKELDAIAGNMPPVAGRGGGGRLGGRGGGGGTRGGRG
jgi:hypothetical protein